MAERRGAKEIRAEMAAEREQLAAALGELRESIAGTRRTAGAAGGAAALALAAAVALRLFRRVRR